MSGWRICPLERWHIDSAVDVHLRAFPDFFLAFLGAGFLKEFYRAFLLEPSAVALVAEEVGTGKVLGVIVGSTEPAGFFRSLLKRRWWAFTMQSAVALFRRPGIAPRLFRALFYRGGAPDGRERALLSSIAVDPLAQGHGMGQKLGSSG